MQARKPVVAGQFYPLERSSCIDQIEQCLQARATSESLPETIVAGIVPHAGWTFSGDLAAMVFSAIKSRHKKVDTFVIFGAAHGYFGESPAVYDKGSWMTPLGEIAVDEELADALLKSRPAVSDIRAHSSEHSIEVQVPFVQYLFAGAKILPIIVPPIVQAVSLGTKAGDIIGREQSKRIVCIGSTDLTHYGPRYGFVPMGTGSEALAWASTVNDQQFIDLALKLRCESCSPSLRRIATPADPAQQRQRSRQPKKWAKPRDSCLPIRTVMTSCFEKWGRPALIVSAMQQ